MSNYFESEPVKGFIYTLEPSRKGSRKLNATAMEASGGVDWKVPYKTVPLAVRKAAKAALLNT